MWYHATLYPNVATSAFIIIFDESGAKFDMKYEFKFRQYAEALYRALKHDAFYVTMEKSIDNGSAAEAMIRYMDYSIIEGEQYGELFIPEKHDYGVSVWAKPLHEKREKEKHRQKETFLKQHIGKGSLVTYKSIINFMSEKAISFIDERSWYLSIIGILPDFQGQGLGIGLVKNILERTDKLGIPTYLETFTPRNITFYHRLGYKAVKYFHEPTVDAEYWLMIRDIGST